MLRVSIIQIKFTFYSGKEMSAFLFVHKSVVILGVIMNLSLYLEMKYDLRKCVWIASWQGMNCDS